MCRQTALRLVNSHEKVIYKNLHTNLSFPSQKADPKLKIKHEKVSDSRHLS